MTNEDDAIHLSLTTTNLKPKQNLSTIFRKFAESTTAHGFGQAAQKRNVFAKLSWIVIMAFCFGFLCAQIHALISHYLSRPVASKVSIVREKEHEFPVVVLCNQNAFTKSKKKIINEFAKHNILHASNERNTAEVMGRFNKSELMQLGHQFNDTFVECLWKKTEDCSAYWDAFWHRRYGVCYGFNSGFKMLANGSVVSKPIKTVTRIGPHSALEIVVNINKKQYTDDTDLAGFRMYIGQQGALYSPFNKGINLSPGLSYSTSLKKKVIQRIDPFKNGSCIPNKVVHLSNKSIAQPIITKYTIEFCYLQCLDKEMKKVCNCSSYWLPKIVDRDREYGECILTAFECSEKVTDDWSSGNMACLEQCNAPCNQVMYMKELSSAQYSPSGQNQFYVRENLIKVSIYFRDLEYELIKDYGYYTIESLLGDIGGQLGLFVGYSVLTVIEIFVLFVQLFDYVIRG